MKSLPYWATANEAFYTYFVAPFKNSASRVYHSGDEPQEDGPTIKGLHHSAYRCRDSEETRKFYEEVFGLRLAGSLAIKETKTARKTDVLHTFFELGDGSYLAFFEAPDMPFDFKAQQDFDLHIALEVDEPTLLSKFAKGKEEGIETRGIADHGMVRSIFWAKFAADRSYHLLQGSERLRHRIDGQDARAL